MSEQPLLDIEALRKIDAKPGDVFVLELSEDHILLDPEDLARANAQINAVLGFEVKVLFVPPGMRLEKLPPAVISYQEASDVTPEQLKELEAAIRKAYAENPPQAMFLPPVAEYKPLAQPPIAVQWHGNMPSVVRVEEPAPSLKEANTAHAAEAANVVKKPLAQPGEKGGYAVPREVALHAVESGVLPPNAVAAVETLKPAEPQADEPHKITFREFF